MEQRSDEWLERRKSHVGGSDIAAILGISPWKSAYELWLEKTRKKEPPSATFVMQRGTDIEAEARDAYMRLSDNIVMPSVCFYEKWPVAMASLDGVNEDGTIIVEIKRPNKHVFSLAKEGKVPEYYKCQIQWQMMVESRAKEADYFCYIDKDNQALITLFPDLDYQKMLLEKAKEFWDCVINDMPPEIKPKDKVLITDEEFKVLEKKYFEADKIEKEAKSLKSALRKELIEFTDDGNCMGEFIHISLTNGRKTIDWKKVCEKFNITDDDLVEFTNYSTPSWVISIE